MADSFYFDGTFYTQSHTNTLMQNSTILNTPTETQPALKSTNNAPMATTTRTPSPPFTLFLVLILFSGVSYARLLSDGGSDPFATADGSSFIRLFTDAAVEETCEQTYGFLPCTTTVFGNLFLILVYGYLMYLPATYISNGSEILMEILGPGLIGGLFLPILGALPDAMLILVSGISGSKEVAQSQVSVGIGMLAGSTVMFLTTIWGSCIVVGKCDLNDHIAVDSTDTKGFSLTGSGVSTDIWTSYAAIIMAVSVVPYIIVQFPLVIHTHKGEHLVVLIALIVSVSLLISYCLYQVFQPWIQRRKIAFAKHKHVISGILQQLKMRALGRLCKDDGTVDQEVLQKLFTAIDENGDGSLSHSELRALVIGIQFDEIKLEQNVALEKVMKDFDSSEESRLSFPDFVSGVERWLNEARGGARPTPQAGPGTIKYIDEFHKQTKRDHYFLGEQEQEQDEDIEGAESPRTIYIKAVLLLLLGTAIAAAFADPLVDAVDNFSTATRIPSFFISFIVLPIATNSAQAVSAIIFASRKKLRSASLTFSELYGAVTMNNLLCLSVFLAIVYIRGLTWNFSSEVLVILIVCVVMGVFGSLRTTFPLWTSLVAFLLFPFSLALVYVLDYVFGWS